MAVPLELAGIEIEDFELEKLPLREYQQTVTTLVQGSLRPSYFGVRVLPKGVAPAWFSCRVQQLYCCLECVSSS